MAGAVYWLLVLCKGSCVFVICSDISCEIMFTFLLFCPLVEITSTLGEGTFGKVVCCKDR